MQQVLGLVTKQTNQGEHNKILTILTPNGSMQIMAYGARRAKSPIMSAAQPFCYSNMQLKKGRGDLPVLDSADIVETFYDLRMSIEKLQLATDLCKLASQTSREGTDCQETLQLLLNTLYILQTREDYEIIKAIFQMRLLCVLGYTPVLNECVICRATNDLTHFSSIHGGMVDNCTQPDSYCHKTSSSTQNLLSHIISSPKSRLYSVKISPATLNEISAICEGYLERLEI